jgi:hypothetical protein
LVGNSADRDRIRVLEFSERIIYILCGAAKPSMLAALSFLKRQAG